MECVFCVPAVARGVEIEVEMEMEIEKCSSIRLPAHPTPRRAARSDLQTSVAFVGAPSSLAPRRPIASTPRIPYQSFYCILGIAYIAESKTKKFYCKVSIEKAILVVGIRGLERNTGGVRVYVRCFSRAGGGTLETPGLANMCSISLPRASIILQKKAESKNE